MSNINDIKINRRLWIIFSVLLFVILGFLISDNKVFIKKHFGFATVYDSFGNTAVSNGWNILGDSYAWGENIGWIDFAPAQGNTYVADNALWGYVWGEKVGWISLNCANSDSCESVDYKVSNDGEGNLSGYAWGENIGWIDFGSSNIDSRNWGVSITSGGDFTGYAYGENIGWISFNSENGGSIVYKVSTNWRPQGSRPQCNNGLDDDNDGDIDYPDDKNCSSSVDDGEKGVIIPVTNSIVEVKYPNGGEILNFGKNYYLNINTTNISTDAILYIDIIDSKGLVYPLTERNIDNISLTSLYFPNSLKEGKYKIRVTCKMINPNTGENGYCSTDGTLESNTYSQDYSDGYFELMYPYVGYSTTTDTKINKNDDLIPINKVTVPVKKVDKFVIKELPDFIKNKTLTFVPQLSSFLFNSLPKDIVNKLEKFQDFSNYLKGLGFYREQDYVRLSIKDFYLNQVYPVPKGLFVVKDGDGYLRVKLTKFDDNDLIAQKVDVNSSSTVSVYLPKNINTKYTINGQVYDFIPDGDFMKTVLEITSENKVLYTESSPTPLVLQVKLESNTFDTVDNPIKSQDINIINKLLKWFGY